MAKRRNTVATVGAAQAAPRRHAPRPQRRARRWSLAIVALGLGWCGITPNAATRQDPLRIAVAANFRTAFEALAGAYEKALAPTYGSTGLLHAQIVQGRPFDAFLAADRERPQALVNAGRAFAPFTYATGQLVLLVNVGAPTPQWLTADRRVAVANPDAAPYGRAAVTALASFAATPRRITALNVAQAFHFANSGAVDGAFVALAQVRALEIAEDRYWIVPANRHLPIEQVAVAIRGGKEQGARAFLEFLARPRARGIIREAGYR